MNPSDAGKIRTTGLVHFREIQRLKDSSPDLTDIVASNSNPIFRWWLVYKERRVQKKLAKHALISAAAFQALLEIDPNDQTAKDYLKMVRACT